MPVGLIDDLKGKAQELIQGNEEAIQDGIEKAGDFVDEKTGGKFAGQVDSVQSAASDFVAKVDGEAEQAPATEETQPQQ
ncbi:antitoxin [Paenarthrobacter sp. NPDC092416]|uniref:antitoxin n=1 Tax=Paenarthrobacter sp. NPDC092416 TaxID=3364386 RepID=UPI00380F38F9